MDRSERAKQFAPFDALRGLREALEEKEREHERREKRMRTEEETEALERVLPLLARGKRAEVLFYEGGFYLQARGAIEEVDLVRRILRIGDGVLSFEDVYYIRLLGTDGGEGSEPSGAEIGKQ